MAVMCTLATAGCATHNPIQEGTATAVIPTKELPAPDPRHAGGDVEQAYYIGPQDKLEVTVYQLPEVTKTVQVDSAGDITLPFVGVLQASGKTASQVRDELAARLRATYMQRPEVTVNVSEAVSQKITIEGAVTTPGVYAVSGKISLIQAMAMAKGTSNLANEKIVAVFRTVKNQRMAAVFDLTMIRKGTLTDPAIYGNDVIVVERSRGKVLLRDVIGTLPLLGVFRTANTVSNL